jgi:hypothetical protein
VPLFFLVVPPADETPAGRAAATLRRELPARFPEHGFEFMEPAEAKRLGISNADDMLFDLLSQRVETEDRSRVLAEEAPFDVHQQIFEFIETTVAAAKRRASN